jgi:predicted AAA+ superfamily ATPase
LTYAEVEGRRPAWKDAAEIPAVLGEPRGGGNLDLLRSLLRLGGFPKPFLFGSDVHARRWRLAYGTTLIREDIGTLENLRDLDRMELLYERLPVCVDSRLSINA